MADEDVSVAWDANNYVQYIRGDVGSDIIICAPHDGDRDPNSIPDRNEVGCLVDGKCTWTKQCTTRLGVSCKPVTKNDHGTKVIAEQLTKSLASLIGKRPHLIINHLHRKKMDGNREINEATCGFPEVVTAYKQFHGFIQEACDSIEGRGLFLDIHGQSHEEQWVEVGYRIGRDELNNGTMCQDKCSIKSLARSCQTMTPVVPFEKLISGPSSFGGLLQSQGYKSVPSPENPVPGRGRYYRGGHNIVKYGSMNGGCIDAIQIELPLWCREENMLLNTASDLAHVVDVFVKLYYR